MKVITVVGARPNFMKVAPVHAALGRAGHAAVMVHTGQHYDASMSEVFFRELGMPQPAVSLHVGSASHAQQTARIMQLIEPVLAREQPDWVLVAGDVNSTLAAALTASKMQLAVAHLEAGLRAFDRRMPEEVNRVVVDHLSTVLLTPSADADAHLAAEGIAAARVRRVGNAMIDTLLQHVDTARLRLPALCAQLGVQPPFALATLHRPSNVDDAPTLQRLLQGLRHVARALPVIFVVHPRTRPRLAGQALPARLVLCGPLGYLDFLALQAHAQVVLTDSGGVQEETTALGIPCLTLRDSTERPITVELGTNTVVGSDADRLATALTEILATGGKRGRVPPLWDGQTAARVVQALEELQHVQF